MTEFEDRAVRAIEVESLLAQLWTWWWGACVVGTVISVTGFLVSWLTEGPWWSVMGMLVSFLGLGWSVLGLWEMNRLRRRVRVLIGGE
jgi:hypothetical protein